MKQTELALRPEEAASDESIKALLCRQFRISPSEKIFFRILKRSVDARSRDVKIRLQILYAVSENLPPYDFEKRKLQNVQDAKPVAVIGCGPAGMFAALRLIELGLKPVIIERGKNVKDRRRDLAAINRQRIINPDSNYCFGEGGAGTYSDGKLYTRSNKRGNVQSILNTFIEFGAAPDIAVDAHPHIGTNKLPAIIEHMREAILSCGGEIHFNTRFEGFTFSGRKLSGLNISSAPENNFQTFRSSPFDACILATGHSARDVFEYFYRANILIEAKPFALGIRIEHPQKIIDAARYHCEIRSEFLPPSSYYVAVHSANKGVYSFCMCPGGIIAPAATAPGEVVVNGWSPSRRNNPYANSGIVVSVDENDFASYSQHGALAALHYRQTIEQKAFEAGGNNLQAPAQRMIDFVSKKISPSLPGCSYIPGVNSVELREVLPREIAGALSEALVAFGKKMKGYYSNEAILVAVESRTSSPVRIPRNRETLMHPQVEGLFPCGEGAGYAGGIVSAAIDGEKCAEQVTAYLKNKL